MKLNSNTNADTTNYREINEGISSYERDNM